MRHRCSLMTARRQKIGGWIALVVTFAITSGCVHADVHRTGRLQLEGGREGTVPVFSKLPRHHREVAVVTVRAKALGTRDRLTKHLRRRASLMGCDGLIRVHFPGADAARGVCIEHDTKQQPAPSAAVAALAPSDSLMRKLANAGPQGRGLLQLLRRTSSKPPNERVWPLKWYLENYPNSQFRDEVRALLVHPDSAPAEANPATMRGAPILE